jgi:hypothetical protein
VDKAGDKFRSFKKQAAEYLEGIGERLKQAIKKIVKETAAEIKEGWGSSIETISDSWDGMISALDKALTAMKELWDRLWDALEEKANTVLTSAQKPQQGSEILVQG